jgi:hypothetical protein
VLGRVSARASLGLVALFTQPRARPLDRPREENAVIRPLAITLVLLASGGCVDDDKPAPSAPVLLPTERPPSNRLVDPVTTPIRPESYTSADEPPPLTPAQRAAIEEANRLAAARAREMESVIVIPPTGGQR